VAHRCITDASISVQCTGSHIETSTGGEGVTEAVRAAWLKPELLQACFATVPQLDRISRATARWPQRRHAGRTVLHRNPQFYEAMQANVLLAGMVR
jgi:hypothetical protein